MKQDFLSFNLSPRFPDIFVCIMLKCCKLIIDISYFYPFSYHKEHKMNYRDIKYELIYNFEDHVLTNGRCPTSKYSSKISTQFLVIQEPVVEMVDLSDRCSFYYQIKFLGRIVNIAFPGAIILTAFISEEVITHY